MWHPHWVSRIRLLTGFCVEISLKKVRAVSVFFYFHLLTENVCLTYQVWFKNRRAKYRKLKGSKETEDRETEERQETGKKDSDDGRDTAEPEDQSSLPRSKRQKCESDRTQECCATILARPTPVSSGYAARAFPIDPRLSSDYRSPYMANWSVLYDSLNYRPTPMTIQQLYPGVGIIHWFCRPRGSGQINRLNR